MQPFTQKEVTYTDPHNEPTMKRLFSLLSLFLATSLAVMAAGTAPTGRPEAGISIFERWEKAPTAIEFHINFDSLEAYRTSAEFIPAAIVEDGQTMNIEVAVRGKFRRRTCGMPPLKIKFEKSFLRAAGLNTHNDFKLVTHCTDDAAGQDRLVREQLAYRLYAILNPAASFHTQLLTINYVNTADGSTTTSYAILIEDTDELKQRMNTGNCKDCYNQPADRIDNATEIALFQYMIGNADYSTKMIRNAKLMTHTDGSITAVPYDFDFSGLVNPGYARLRAGQHSITDRILIWEYEQSADFSSATQTFLELEAEFLDTIEGTDKLSKQSRREISKYVKDFYQELRAGKIGA